MKLLGCFNLVCLVALCAHAINMLHVCHAQGKVLSHEIAVLNAPGSPLSRILEGQADGWWATLWIAIVLIFLWCTHGYWVRNDETGNAKLGYWHIHLHVPRSSA